MSLITRADAVALMPEEEMRTIFDSLGEESYALRFMRRLRNMSTRQMKLNVMDSLATAYFVNGTEEHEDYEAPNYKKTTKVSWKNKYIYPEEIAVIVPIPEDVIADSGYPIWPEVRKAVIDAIRVRIDESIFFANAPFTWPDPIITGATAAGNVVAFGTEIDFADDVSNLMAVVEADGYDVTGFLSDVTMKHRLRTMRDTAGRPLLMQSMAQGTMDMLHGVGISYMKNGVFNTGSAVMIAGDFQQAVYSWRQDLTFKLLDQAVIQDEQGAILYNLAQQDMVAMRVVCRLGWQIPNPINRMNQVEADRYPFAIMTP